MKIFQFGKTLFSADSGGGSDRVFAALARNLPNSQTTLRGLVIGTPSSAGSFIPGIESTAMTGESLISRLRSVRRSFHQTLSEETPDLVASHFALYTAPVLDLLHEIPLIVHFHGPWASESRMEGESIGKVALKRWIESRVYRRSDRFIVLSEAFRDILTREYGVDSAKIEIVPGGVDVNLFNTGLSRGEARRRLGWPTDRPILLAVRRLVHRVGLGPLIEALDTIRRHVPNILLMIAGKGPLRASLQQKARSLDLTEHVQFLGFVPDADLPTTYRAADLSVMPTQGLEGFGLSAVESLAAGTPVAVTPVGGLPSVVSDLSNALIFQGSNVTALASRLTGLLDGSVPLPRPRECQAHARKHFDWSVIADQTRYVYEEVIA